MPVIYSPTVQELLTKTEGPEPNIPVPFLSTPTLGSLPIIDPDPEIERPSRHGT